MYREQVLTKDRVSVLERQVLEIESEKLTKSTFTEMSSIITK
jgi:hypothetical protein